MRLLENGIFDLENDGDFQTHSGEIKMDKLSLGFYVLLTASSEGFSFIKIMQ